MLYMPEDTGKNTNSGVRVLTPDDDEARIIAKAMSSSTAGEILRSFQGREMTASDLATCLKIPIPTLLYHLDSLLEAGLIEISRIRYSVKGREVKVYKQSDRVVIVAPRHADLKALLLKYASLFGITILGAGVVSLFLPLPLPEFMGSGLPLQETKGTRVFSVVANKPVESLADYTSSLPANPHIPAPAPNIPLTIFPGISDVVVGMLIGGVLIIVVLLFFELISRRR